MAFAFIFSFLIFYRREVLTGGVQFVLLKIVRYFLCFRLLVNEAKHWKYLVLSWKVWWPDR